MVVLLDFFFFQAEDGIRDLVRSRGLGDVYKRQPYPHICAIDEACGRLPAFQMATPGVQLDAT